MRLMNRELYDNYIKSKSILYYLKRNELNSPLKKIHINTTNVFDEYLWPIHKSMHNQIQSFNEAFQPLQQQVDKMRLMVHNAVQPIHDHLSQLESILSTLSKINIPKLDIEKLREVSKHIQEKYVEFFKECTTKGILPSYIFIDEFEEQFSRVNIISDEFIESRFEKDYEEIKSTLLEHRLYEDKLEYLSLAMEDFESRRYAQCLFLMFACLDYIVVYSLFQRELGRYNPIKKTLRDELNEMDVMFIDSQYVMSFKTITEKYYDNNNSVEDPDLINRNRLMHGMMDITNIHRIDCIKVFYLLHSIVDIEVKNVT